VNCTLLLQALRAELDAQGARDGHLTYDFHSGSKIAHFNAPLYTATGDPTPGYTVDSTMQRYLRGGVSPSKLVVGIPFYGRVYGGVGSANDGLFQAVTGTVPTEWRKGTDYKAIVRRSPETLGFRRVMHPEARVPFLYNAETGTWITYDDAESVGEKTAYVRTRGLGGVMAWEIGGDDGTLIRTMYEGLRGKP
jgi:chitinase